MSPQFREVVAECAAASDDETITFPDVVRTLMAVGVERYHADLVRGERTFFLPDGDNVAVSAHKLLAPPAAEFSGDGVAAALKAIQQGAIQYRTFCARIAEAGCVAYVVSLAGRRAVYYGRTGETYTEHFPGSR
jgi:uncharacterized protein YbcV (DUF1398 family)